MEIAAAALMQLFALKRLRTLIQTRDCLLRGTAYYVGLPTTKCHEEVLYLFADNDPT